ncbi:MAG: aminoacetone oxidase family FAD-binding enzyme [Acidobacteriota bacterium]
MMDSTARPPVVVIGAGAAGLVAAIFARRGGQPVLVLEKTTDGGRKILISGGGRCNVLPDALEPERFVTDSSPALLRRLLRSWPIASQRAFFETDLGVPLAFEAATRKWFPASNRARDIRDRLVAVARDEGVTFQFGSAVVALQANVDGWRVTTAAGDQIVAARVVLATGGLSVPMTGSDGIGLSLAAGLGHVVHETYPALTPLLASPPVHAALSGVSLDVRLRARADGKITDSRGGFLFTHRGYSGPSVLDVSHTAVRSRPGALGDRTTIRAQWCDLNAEAWHNLFESSSALVVNLVARHLPQRLAEQLITESGIPMERRLAELRRAERTGLIERLTAYALPWTGDEGYQKAEVTGGGIALDEVHSKTMESRRQAGLFFCGEVLDAFGPIGGHNFAWAWATGRLAGLGAARVGPGAATAG